MMIVKKIKLLKFLAVISMCLSILPVYALGKLSRACPVAEIPLGLKTAAMIFFEAIGNASIGSLQQLVNLPQTEQYKHYILESITTDFLEARYYLYAEARVRRYYNAPNSLETVMSEYTHKSPSWTPSSLPSSLLADPRVSILIANRQALYSARAGHPNIVEYKPINNNEGQQFTVVGRHYYLDPINNVQVNLGISKARDCNLSNWGGSLADR